MLVGNPCLLLLFQLSMPMTALEINVKMVLHVLMVITPTRAVVWLDTLIPHAV